MKFLKSFVGATALAAAISLTAPAAKAAGTHIYITGSTAFRTAALAAINANVTGGTTGNDSSISGTGNTSFIWNNVTVAGVTGTVTIAASFTGSEAGTAAVANTASLIPFLPDGVTGTTNASAYTDVAGSVPNANYPTALSDIAFSDVFQASTPFNGTLPVNHVTYAALTDTKVGIATFKWVASKGFPITANAGTAVSTPSSAGGVSTISIEPQFIASLYKGGQSWLSLMTGNTFDADVELYASGRNPDSGTRATALADSAYGVSSSVKQYQVTASGTTATAIALFPVQTIAGLSTNTPGNSGEASGGNLRVYAGDTYPAGLSVTGNLPSAMYFVMYLGISDAATAIGLGGVELPYKGVTYTTSNVYTGKYTYWSYEHLFERSSPTAAGGTFYTTLANALTALPPSQNAAVTAGIASVGLNVNDPAMWVSRGGDGQNLVGSTVFNNILQSSSYPF